MMSSITSNQATFFSLDNCEVIRHEYRTAKVRDIILSIEEPNDDSEDYHNDVIELQEELDKKAGKKYADNHVVYEVKTSEGNVWYLWLTDWDILVGLSIEKVNW